ncbi:MAG: hypothetical protein BYD32DRAFT_271020 [Podila humilis]|nr:MAG: hypothetical protein BYD32DRAFT_271020 [Podila humilis]
MGDILNLGVDIVLSLDNVAHIVFVLLLFGHVFLLAHDGQVFFFFFYVDFSVLYGVLECMLFGRRSCFENRGMRLEGGRREAANQCYKVSGRDG